MVLMSRGWEGENSSLIIGGDSKPEPVNTSGGVLPYPSCTYVEEVEREFKCSVVTRYYIDKEKLVV